MTTSNPIKRARIIKGLSVAELARRCSVSRQAAANWDNGLSWPKPEMLLKLAGILDVPVGDLAVHELGAPVAEGDDADQRPSDVAGLLARCRVDIAKLLNVPPEKVELKMSLVS